MDLKAKLEAAKAAAEAAKAAISPEDAEEIKLRAEIAGFDEAKAEADREARKLDLDRREDAARAKLGSSVLVRGVDLEASTPGAGTFVLRTPSMQAWNAFRKGIGDAHADHGAVYRNFAIASIHDHNGVAADWMRDDAAGAKLSAVLAAYPAIAVTISNVGGELAGLADTRKKSGG